MALAWMCGLMCIAQPLQEHLIRRQGQAETCTGSNGSWLNLRLKRNLRDIRGPAQEVALLESCE